METRIRRKLSMASRALGFAREHVTDDPGFGPVVERLGAQVALANQLHDNGLEATSDERAAILRRTNLRRQLRDMGQHVSSVAEIAIKEQPSLAGEFPAPRARSTNRDFFHDSRVLWNKAKAHAEVLAAHGLSATLVERMEKALAAYEQYGEDANAERAGHVSARENIADVVADCMNLVDVLDSYYKALYADNPGDLRAWLGARDVYGRVSRAPETATDDGVAGTIPPAPTGEAGAGEEAA